MGILFPQFIETSSNKDTTTSISTDLEISSLSLSAYQPPWHHWPFPSFSNSSPGLWDMHSSGCPPITLAHLHKEAILFYHRGSPSASFAGSPSSLPPVTVRAPRAWSLVLVIYLISAILRCTYSPPHPHFNISESGHILPSLCLKIMFGRWELRGIFIAYLAQTCRIGISGLEGHPATILVHSCTPKWLWVSQVTPKQESKVCITAWMFVTPKCIY